MPIIHHIKDTPRGFIAGAFILFVTARLVWLVTARARRADRPSKFAVFQGETDVIQTMEEANEKVTRLELCHLCSRHFDISPAPRNSFRTVHAWHASICITALRDRDGKIAAGMRGLDKVRTLYICRASLKS